MDTAAPGLRVGLYKFKDFGRRGAGIGVSSRQSGADRAEGESLVAKEEFFSLHALLRSKDAAPGRKGCRAV